MSKKFLIVGAGLSGAVLARELATNLNCRILVIDSRSHLAGNCHTARDGETGVMVHEYGPHVFNTNHEDVWAYVNRFATFKPYFSRIKAVTPRGLFSLPINLMTINQFFGKNLCPDEARVFLAGLGDKTIEEPSNFEEQALKMVGRDLYENFFYGYTKKQWGREPRELPASILKRLPIRFNYEDSYYDSRHQGIPEEGYTEMVSRILEAPGIEVALNTFMSSVDRGIYDHVFYTGPIDAYFGFSLGRLGYRTVTFDTFHAQGDYQGTGLINYTGLDVSYTRIHEHKHFTPWENHAGTVVTREYSKQTEPEDVPFYPTRLAEDRDLFERYVALAREEERTSFLGRLGTYRYLDMDQVIGEALDFSRSILASGQMQCLIPSIGPHRNKTAF